MTSPQIALLAAFPFPARLGSQHYFGEQARALVDAGARVTLFCYASGEGAAPPGTQTVRAPRALSPRALRAGPNLGKPFADTALAGTFLRHARSAAFDAVLAHNAEAAAIALAARVAGGPPVVYVAHTLLGRELDAWFPQWLAGPVEAAGTRADRFLAARADAVLVLCQEAAEALGPHARGPIETVPPGHRNEPEPTFEQRTRACARAGVEPGKFALYTGNVERYQELPVLAAAARLAPELPVVVATHGEARFEAPNVRCVHAMPEEARALAHASAVTLVTRRRQGGFPIKLLQYMEAGCAIVAREGIADTLRHDQDAWLLPRDAGAAAFGQAMRTLQGDPERRARLGRAARETLATHHDWQALAHRTLALAEEAHRVTLRARNLARRSPPS